MTSFLGVQKHLAEKDLDKSDIGPDRRKLPTYKLLGHTDPALVQAVADCLAEVSGLNDVDQDSYPISQLYPNLRAIFPEDYRQVLLQGFIGEGKHETDFRLPKHTGVTQYVDPFVPEYYRARIAILSPGAQINWHIDTNTSQMCRVQFPVVGEQHWKIQRGKTIEEKILRPGEVWFVNTGLKHTVVNEADVDRVTVLVGCRFSAIQQHFHLNAETQCYE